MSSRIYAFVFLAVVALAACAADPEPEPAPEPAPTPVLDGNWGGSTSGLTLKLTLSQLGETVSGNGTMVGDSGSISVSVFGTNVYPNVSLAFKSSGYNDSNFSGRFLDDNTIHGTLNGSGFAGESLNLVKQ